MRYPSGPSYRPQFPARTSNITVHFLWNHRARFCPAAIPFFLIREKNHAEPLPLNSIHRFRKAELRILAVVAGVSQTVSAMELNKPRILNPAALFILRLRRQHRAELPREVNTVPALHVTEARSPRGILRAVEHHVVSVSNDDCGIESTGLCQISTSRREDGTLGNAFPIAEDILELSNSSSAEYKSNLPSQQREVKRKMRPFYSYMFSGVSATDF